MPDIASLGIEINTAQIVEGKKALDQLGESSVKVDQAVRSANGQMNDTSKIMKAQAEQARAAAMANAALGSSTNQASLGAQIFIEKLNEQVAVLGMSRSQLAAYQAAQLGVSKEAEASVAKLKAYEDAIKAAADAKAEAAKQSNILTDSLKLLAAGYGALKLGEYIKDAALLAARYETLGVVATVVGKNAGYTKTQMDTATDAIARQGITMIESHQSAIKLVQAHVDLTNATGLARIAQDAAVIGNINSSEAFDRLVNGIARGNVLILRNIGINVNLQAAYQQMADSLGKSTKELTENERVQARLNSVLERGTDIAGTYEAAMDTAGKQLKSMQRYTEDLKTVIGETFNEVLTIGVMALTDHLKDANKEVTELSKNQQLHEWGRTLADVFVWVANKVGNATTLMRQAAAFSDHQSAQNAIESKYKALTEANSKNSSFWDVGFTDSGKRLASAKAAELAEENVAYVTNQAKLSSQYDAFEKAAVEREKIMTAKHKDEVDARLKVDQDYAAKAAALLIANVGKSIEVQQAAQAALAKSVYVGTPTFRDTEGREPKAKVDKVESTELADRLARIQDDVNAEKQMYDTMSKMDDMFHAAGKMGDAEYYENKRKYADSIANEQIAGYTKQITELKKYHDSTEAEAAKHAKQINDIEAKREVARAAAQDEQNLLAAKESLRKDAIASASEDAMNKYLESLNQEAKKLEESNAAHETSKGAVERETIARLDLAIAYQKQFIEDQKVSGATAEEIARAPAVLKYLEDVRAARFRIANGLDTQQSNQFKDKAADQAIKDWQRAGQTIADSLTSAFGAGGKALGGMFQAYAKGMEGQLRAQKELAAAKKLADDNPEKIEAVNRAQLSGVQSQIQGYAGMTSAAQGFFSEGSRGYQAMHAATVALQGAEIALSLIKGVNAVLTQGEGDPYTAFGRMAAMTAIVASLGVAISGGGGGGGSSAADVQKLQGTGAVFGDSAAKSDSIRKSIESLKANSDLLVPINQGMLTSLQSIEASMTGLTNLVVRTTGLTDGTNMGIQTGTLSRTSLSPFAATLAGTNSLGGGIGGGAIGFILGGPIGAAIGSVLGSALGSIAGKIVSLWGSTKQTIVDSGLQYGGSVRGLQSGAGFNQYASIDTTKSSWFGLSKSTSNSVQTQGLNDELSRQFGLIFSNLDSSLQAAAVAMGGSAADVAKVLDGLTLESTKVSLKGLTGTALTDALNSVISKSMDEISSAVFPQFEQFRQVGEGYAETVMRLAGDYAKLDSILAATSSSFGMTGAASIAARERVIELAGGIDNLASETTSFAKNFLTEAQQLAPVQKYVTAQLAAMGLQSIDTRDKFKDYVLGLIASGALATEAGAQQYAALMKLESAFAKVVPAIEDTSMTLETAKNALASAYSAESDAIKSTITSTQDYIKSLSSLRDSMLIGNLSPLTPQQQYAEASRQYEATKAAALGGDATAQGNLQNAMTAFLTASRTVNASNDKYKADFAETQADLALAIASGKTQVSTAEASLIALNKQVTGLVTVNESVLSVAAAIKQLAGVMGSSGSNTVANSSTSAITSLYQSVLGRAPDASGLQFWTNQLNGGVSLSAISAAMAQSTEYQGLHGSHATGLSYVPFNKYRAELHEGEGVLTKSENLNYRTMGAGLNAALVAEVKALRSEVSGLRADQAKQTAALIISNAQVTEQAADKVADATVSSADAAAWADKTAPKVS